MWKQLLPLVRRYLNWATEKDASGKPRHPFRTILAWIMLLTLGSGFVADNHSDILLAPDADLLQINERLVKQNVYLRARVSAMIDLAAKISSQNERLEYFQTAIETEQSNEYQGGGGNDLRNQRYTNRAANER